MQVCNEQPNQKRLKTVDTTEDNDYKKDETNLQYEKFMLWHQLHVRLLVEEWDLAKTSLILTILTGRVKTEK